MASKWKWLLLLALYTTYPIHEVWTLKMFSVDKMVTPYIFLPNQQVSEAYFVFGACEYLIWVVWAAVVHVLFVEARSVTIWFLIFQSLEVVEYFLTYNEPLYFIPVPGEDIGINITNIKIVVMFPLVVKKFFTWNRGK
jgi:hypothetical protein